MNDSETTLVRTKYVADIDPPAHYVPTGLNACPIAWINIVTKHAWVAHWCAADKSLPYSPKNYTFECWYLLGTKSKHYPLLDVYIREIREIMGLEDKHDSQ